MRPSIFNIKLRKFLEIILESYLIIITKKKNDKNFNVKIEEDINKFHYTFLVTKSFFNICQLYYKKRWTSFGSVDRYRRSSFSCLYK